MIWFSSTRGIGDHYGVGYASSWSRRPATNGVTIKGWPWSTQISSFEIDWKWLWVTGLMGNYLHTWNVRTSRKFQSLLWKIMKPSSWHNFHFSVGLGSRRADLLAGLLSSPLWHQMEFMMRFYHDYFICYLAAYFIIILPVVWVLFSATCDLLNSLGKVWFATVGYGFSQICYLKSFKCW